MLRLSGGFRFRAVALVYALGCSGVAVADPGPAAYPNAVLTRIGGDLVAGGHHFRMAYFLTADPLARVIRHFWQSWRGSGFPTVVQGDLRSEGTVSAFLTREGRLWMVVLRAHEGKTLGFTVVEDLRALAAPGSQPGGRSEGELFSAELGAGGGVTEPSARSEIVRGEVNEVGERLMRRLEREGFALAQTRAPRSESDPLIVELEGKDQERMVIVLASAGPGVTAVLRTRIPAPVANGTPP
jgi:hypothetical protein